MVPVNLDRPATSLKWRTLFYQAFEVPVLDPLAEAAPNATPAELNEAGARDRRAQRALLRANLRILEARKTILEKMKYEMISTMRREIMRVLEERSDLGVGYADYVFPPLA